MIKEVTCMYGTGYRDLVLTRSLEVKEYLHLSLLNFYQKRSAGNIISMDCYQTGKSFYLGNLLSKDLSIENACFSAIY